MEEQKEKTVKMDVIKNEGTPKKLTYEELNNTCAQLYQQNQQLLRQVQQLNNAAMFKRLDYLFLVLQNEKVFNDKDFVNSCTNEIKEALSVEPAAHKEE